MKEITVIDISGFSTSISSGLIIGMLSVVLAVTLTLYVLRSIGLFVMAKKQGIKNPWIAILPFVWVWTACKIIGDARIFGKVRKNFASFALLVVLASELLTLIINLIVFVPICGYYMQGGEILISMGEKGIATGFIPYPLYQGLYVKDNFLYPYLGANWLVTMAIAFSYVVDVADLISIFVMVTIYIAIFRKYWPEHNVLASVLSVFTPIFGVLVFAVRNRQPVDFEKYMRQKFYGMHYGSDNSGYNTQNTYGREDINKDPFGFDQQSEKKDDDDPFPEFKNENRRD